MGDSGRELVRLVQIDWPQCAREYGDAQLSPTGSCQAVLGSTGNEKCHNSPASCQDPAHYLASTLTLTFGFEAQGALWRYYGYVIPSLQGVSTTPGSINLANMDEESSALGTREQVSITFKDHLHSDLFVDKYRTQRATGGAAAGSPPRIYAPYQRGTFWGKMLARQRYHQGIALRVYDGYLGDALAAMRVRYYVIDRIEGPADGMVRLVAKDVFSLIDVKKAVYPAVSKGRLLANISGVSASPAETFQLTPSGIGNLDYPTAGFAVIGSEEVRFTRSGDVVSLQDRGVDGTAIKTHDADDLFQLVGSLAPGKAHDHVWTILCTTPLGTPGSPTGSSYIDKAAWDALAASNINLYSRRVAKPTPVEELVGQLCEIAGFTLIPNVTTNKIDLVMLRPGPVTPTVTDGEWIKSAPPIRLRRQDNKRVSQVWVYFAQIDPTKSTDEETNYHSCYVLVDSDAESSQQYGSPAIRKIFAPWIPAGGRSSASETAERIRAMFRDPPLQADFALEVARDGELELARYFNLQTADQQDFTGAAKLTAMAPIQLHTDQAEISVQAQAVTFSGALSTTTRSIYIDNDCQNLNLRTFHDQLFEAPAAGSPNLIINFYIIAGTTVGSASTTTPAIDVGDWPNGVALLLQVKGRAGGKGGKGADGAQAGSTTLAGNNGETGGTAIKARRPITIDNTTGQIWAGGGGGGAGQTRGDFVPADWAHSVIAGGGAGAPGAGSEPGELGLPGASTGNLVLTPATAGVSASATAAGTPGTGAGPEPLGELDHRGGNGGNGGGPGLPGSNGSLGSGGTVGGAVGTAGLAGYAIDGIAFVTWVGSPDTDRGDTRGRFV